MLTVSGAMVLVFHSAPSVLLPRVLRPMAGRVGRDARCFFVKHTVSAPPTMTVCYTQLNYATLKEEVAPFVMENLGCSGNEARLVDCPAFNGTQDPALTFSPTTTDYGPDDYYDDGKAPNFDYDRDDYLIDFNSRRDRLENLNRGECHPFRANYARVACGTAQTPSAMSIL